jgi:hypothetical protein
LRRPRDGDLCPGPLFGFPLVSDPALGPDAMWCGAIQPVGSQRFPAIAGASPSAGFPGLLEFRPPTRPYVPGAGRLHVEGRGCIHVPPNRRRGDFSHNPRHRGDTEGFAFRDSRYWRLNRRMPMARNPRNRPSRAVPCCRPQGGPSKDTSLGRERCSIKVKGPESGVEGTSERSRRANAILIFTGKLG